MATKRRSSMWKVISAVVVALSTAVGLIVGIVQLHDRFFAPGTTVGAQDRAAPSPASDASALPSVGPSPSAAPVTSSPRPSTVHTPTVVAPVQTHTAPAPHTQPTTTSPKLYKHHVYHTCSNGKCGLDLHPGPGYTGANSRVTRTLVDGDTVQIVCQKRGASVSGLDGSTSNVWDKLVQGDWAADYYIDTSGTLGSFSPPIPEC